MKKVIREVECNRCGHRWIPRSFETPNHCPKCGSPYWNRPRVRKYKNKKEVIK